jgi:hypothetical protein
MNRKSSVAAVAGTAFVLLAAFGCAPPPSPPGGNPNLPQGQCLLSKADAPATMAFCETFDAPKGNPATRSGDLDPTLWGVSRHGEMNPPSIANNFQPARMDGCGNPTVLPPATVKVCNGRMYDVVNDNHTVIAQAMYPKQPFDIAGRTGTVSFDVSNDSDGIHAAWPEFWWTDQPIPAPSDDFPLHAPLPRNGVGVSIGASGGPTCPNRVAVDQISVIRNYVLQQVPFTSTGCLVKGSANGPLNHFEIRINQSRIEVWGSDAGSTAVRLIAVADNANITMTRGVIWVQDMHYNASKAGCCGGVDGRQTTHTFAWDNIAFDGPKPYRDLTFDVTESQVPSNGGVNLGWGVSPNKPLTLGVPGVTWAQTPTTVLVTFNFFCEATVVPNVSVNGLPAHATPWPYPGGTDFTYRTIAVPVALSEIHPGTNILTFTANDNAAIANVNIALIAAAPVP